MVRFLILARESMDDKPRSILYYCNGRRVGAPVINVNIVLNISEFIKTAVLIVIL